MTQWFAKIIQTDFENVLQIYRIEDFLTELLNFRLKNTAYGPLKIILKKRRKIMILVTKL